MEHRILPQLAVRGVLLGQWAYWCSLAVAALSLRWVPRGSIRTLVMLTPVLTALLCVSMAYWIYRDCDEYVRFQLLKSIAVTAIVVALSTVLYFFLELAGFPRVSMLWVNVLGWSVFNLQMLVVILRAR